LNETTILKCCELGFILAGHEGAFKDGQALAVDLIYLGMILDVVHSWADDTMCEATYETPPNMCMSMTRGKMAKDSVNCVLQGRMLTKGHTRGDAQASH
jgi:hypothetical protein